MADRYGEYGIMSRLRNIQVVAKADTTYAEQFGYTKRLTYIDSYINSHVDIPHTEGDRAWNAWQESANV